MGIFEKLNALPWTMYVFVMFSKFQCTNETSWFHRSFAYIENQWHITEIELVLLLVELLELRCVVVLTLLCYVCPHMSLLFSLEPHAQQNLTQWIQCLLKKYSISSPRLLFQHLLLWHWCPDPSSLRTVLRVPLLSILFQTAFCSRVMRKKRLV